MPRYSDPIHPELAAVFYGRVPGNYVIYFADGSAYPGRQARTTNRIQAALNQWRDVIAVRFMSDHSDDECVRASREHGTIVGLLRDGVPLRNQRMATTPQACLRRKR